LRDGAGSGTYSPMMIDVDTLVQALANGTRLRPPVLLTREGSLCVCELTAALDISQPKMSRHLATLKVLGLVQDARIANRVFSHVHPELPGWAQGVIDDLADGMTGAPEFASIARRLEELPNRSRQRPGLSPVVRLISGVVLN
jgi:ArsR family transcriptional regulator, arsenate/arsenite/antimonite-responsive transcriptional repressor